MKRPAVTLLFTVPALLFALPAPAGALDGSVISQTLLNEFGESGCTKGPCGYYGAWSGRGVRDA